MNYPLSLSFKIVALAPQIQVTDASGNSICYVKQKLLKLKEAVSIFTDKTKSETLCEIAADRIIDFSASYHFTDNSGNRFGNVRRKGMRSIFKAHYEIFDGENQFGEIKEENAWAKIGDSFFSEIPLIGMFSGYLFHPSYIVTSAEGQPIARLKKQAAFFEGRFELTKLGEMGEVEELRVLMSLLMMILLERRRG